MKITKGKIAQYCVNSNGDKDLAEAIAKQFERAGFKRNEMFPDGLEEHHPVGIFKDGEIHNWIACPATETTLEALTKMVDELLGDEYDIVREFLEYYYPDMPKANRDEIFHVFKHKHSKHHVTLSELKAVYAQSKGIEVGKIEVREEGK